MTKNFSLFIVGKAFMSRGNDTAVADNFYDLFFVQEQIFMVIYNYYLINFSSQDRQQNQKPIDFFMTLFIYLRKANGILNTI